MSIITATVVLLAAVCALQLLLTLGVIRRLREHTAALAGVAQPPASLGVGDEVGAFSSATVDGEPVERDSITDETLVAFFTPGCGPCEKRLPEFVSYAGSSPGTRDRPIAVVVAAEAGDADPYVEALRPVARVFVQDSDGAMCRAFQVTAFPTVVKVAPASDGRVVITSDRIRLDQPASVPA
ncbi:hypothetical protein [Micromonospora sp. WMMD964]|uniref:TlpA family protein disulfide reductase n=1 Tax=Micromonospora sp. WMMD964 TaxID=3016091 RepID=UPI00249C37DB|nr:hypothetical protein [Micromonospora sp. WMMD964]WFF00124.1 hypothetical protein O7616_25005 [Micromonospora sp. WMMD964]